MNNEWLTQLLNIELEDDESPYGGTEFKGEKLKDFLGYCEKMPKDLNELNLWLSECGIKPLTI